MRRRSCRRRASLRASFQFPRLSCFSRKAKALVGYLALSNQHQELQDRVAALIWPDRDLADARRALANAVLIVEKAITLGPNRKLFRRGGFVGLNAAYIDGSAAYHTPQDDASTMDQASLQHHGDNALALARAFGAADLAEVRTPAGYDASYFPVLGLLVQYPGWLVWPLAVLALVAVGALAYLLRRRGEITWGRLAAGSGLALAPLVAAPVLAQLLWLLLVTLRPGYAEMIDPWRPGWFRAAVVALVVAVVLAWYALARPRIPKPRSTPPKERPTLSNMLDGFRFIWRQKIILGAISLDLFAVLMGGVIALLPVYADDILHLGPEP